MYFCHNRAFDNMPLRIDFHDVTDPRDYIGAFFHGYDLHVARKFLFKWLHAVTKGEPGKLQPETLHLFYTRFERLIESAFIVNQMDNGDRAAIIKEPKDGHLNPMTIGLFFKIARRDKGSTHPARLAWEYFPRYLSYKEFLNPYLVLRKCFNRFILGEWRELIRELYSLGIRRQSFSYEDLDHDIPSLYRQLGKFLEACHLIELREEMLNIGDVMAAAIIEESSHQNA